MAATWELPALGLACLLAQWVAVRVQDHRPELWGVQVLPWRKASLVQQFVLVALPAADLLHLQALARHKRAQAPAKLLVPPGQVPGLVACLAELLQLLAPLGNDVGASLRWIST